jgi:hypothetical protein
MISELEMVLKQEAVAFNVLFRHLPEEPEENHENPQPA